MDELKNYIIMFYSTDTMDNPEVFNIFAQHTLVVSTKRVINIIINVSGTFTKLLGSLDNEIDSFVK